MKARHANLAEPIAKFEFLPIRPESGMLKVIAQKWHQIRLDQKRHVLECERRGRATAPRSVTNIVEEFRTPSAARRIGCQQNAQLSTAARPKAPPTCVRPSYMPCG